MCLHAHKWDCMFYQVYISSKLKFNLVVCASTHTKNEVSVLCLDKLM